MVYDLFTVKTTNLLVWRLKWKGKIYRISVVFHKTCERWFLFGKILLQEHPAWNSFYKFILRPIPLAQIMFPHMISIDLPNPASLQSWICFFYLIFSIDHKLVKTEGDNKCSFSQDKQEPQEISDKGIQNFFHILASIHWELLFVCIYHASYEGASL